MRTVLKKILTAMRGGVNELGEAVVDGQGNRILEQELRDSEHELKQAKQELASLMAEAASLARQIRTEQDSAAKREDDARKAIAAGQEDLAREVAERIVGHERRASELTQTRELLQQRIVGLKDRVQKAEKQLADYRRELQVVKTNERVLRTTAQIDTNINSQQSSLSTAKETLERIRERQAREEDRQTASATLEKELTGADLDEKLKAAGIDGEQDAVNDVLARLKGGNANP
ncbi:MAG TPA: phage shock protein A [Marinobacter hydrocarbonoclasticus]|jgi:phage shock protein A|uniref:Phage shock protein A (PspA) family protein n=1 Tax=Marinobacter nauticus TaxID=2743 RepID=A0A350RZQ1_MARNT|nr:MULTISPECIES: PspA/IM30 family protein [Marinobacter]MAC22620.1 phage shock protein A [Marinobacter sp.]RCW63665.1 phage shock protein A (PspA) family protein [Marinobacter nauticus]CCG97067.1 PspA/IM30 [Marinobacter nauticus ATCC 49840]HAX11269.1 phage shock protein A [Marinobacter nauticus]HCL38075.1 phage shock protein A [Marinobacter nauticus]|tara:strand:+ start:1047 stop:1745 length:699 start_codon:yes stop_codon:yes gene_type:complete